MSESVIKKTYERCQLQCFENGGAVLGVLVSRSIAINHYRAALVWRPKNDRVLFVSASS